jgi:hypothetical protein
MKMPLRPLSPVRFTGAGTGIHENTRQLVSYGLVGQTAAANPLLRSAQITCLSSARVLSMNGMGSVGHSQSGLHLQILC